jgi:hypothetical protein
VSIVSFVCSIGNVPLAAVLWNGGISFGGVIAFIYADLLILPTLNIYRKCYRPTGKNGLGQPHRLRTHRRPSDRRRRTNRTVAQQLHLSPHTVKTHLHNAFAKLGITSRAQLTQLMRRSD